jgi:hypothetical protein
MVMNDKRISKDSYADSSYEIVIMIYSETLVAVKADLAEKPIETGGNATPTTIINIDKIDKLGVLGNVQAKNVQTGDHSSIHKQPTAEEKKKSIIWKILKVIVKIIGAIVIGVIVAVVIDILGDFGWLQSIKASIHHISWPK